MKKRQPSTASEIVTRAGKPESFKLHPDFFQKPLKDWLQLALTTNKTDDSNIPGATTFSYVCWLIWKYIKEFFQSERVFTQQVNTYYTIHFGWTTPPIGWFKLNSDASRFQNSGNTAFGGVIRDPSGAWVRWKHWREHSELWSIYKGIQITVELKIDNIIIEANSSTAVSALLNLSLKDTHPWGTIVDICRGLMRQFKKCRLQHIHREGNQLADSLAKKGHETQEQLVILCNISPDVNLIYLADQVRCNYPQTINYG